MNVALRRILLALLVTSSTTASADDGLHMIVRGPVDHEAVRTRLAAELAMPVTEVLGTCDVPCLDISVDGGTATLLYSPRTGAPRLRTLALGTDTSQWATVITLLAGNIARDEASVLLAQLPEETPELPAPADDGVIVPPAPESPVVIARPPPRTRAEPRPIVEGEHRTFAFGLVPGLSSDLVNTSTRHWLAIHGIVGISGGSTGLSVSGVADVSRGSVSGVQLSGVASIGRRVSGLQIGGVAAVAGELHGVQLAGAAAIADAADGAQIGGVATVARRGAGGLQIAGVVAITGGSAGPQIAGVAAVARGIARTQIAGLVAAADRGSNVQIAGVASVTRGDANVQIAGLANVARDLRGVQIAPFNVARRVDGVQVGVINVGGAGNGLSFGLINIVPGGRTDLEGTIDSNHNGVLLLRHGGRRWHNVYGIGGRNVDETGPADDVWMYGLGFGPSWRTRDTAIDLEAICWQVNHGSRHSSELSLLNQLRLTVAVDVGPVEVVAGGAINVYVSTDQQSPLIIERRVTGDEMDTGVTVKMWPSAFVGVRL